jgi:hypothetical protein
MNTNNFLPLAKKHDQWLLFTERIRKGLGNGTDLNTIREYAVYYWQYHLKPHFYQEESLFIPLANHCSLAGQFQKEHEDITELVASLDRSSHKTVFSILTRFIENLVRFEQHILLRYLNSILSEEQKTEMNLRLAGSVAAAKEWKKEFWLGR